MPASGDRIFVLVGLTLLALVGPAAGAPAPRPRVVAVDVETDGGRLGHLVGEQRGRVAYFGLDDLARLVGGRVGRAANGRQATLLLLRGTVELTRDRSQVRAGGRVVALSAPVRVSSGRWVVPGDLLVRALPPVLGQGIRVAAAASPDRPPVASGRGLAPGITPPSAPALLTPSPTPPTIATVALGPGRSGPVEGVLPAPGPSVMPAESGDRPSVRGPAAVRSPAAPSPSAAGMARPPAAPAGVAAPPPSMEPSPAASASSASGAPGVAPPPAAPLVPPPPLGPGAPALAPVATVARPIARPAASEAAPRDPATREAAPREPAREPGGRDAGDDVGELRYRSYPTYTRVVIEGPTATEPRLVETPSGLVVTLPGFAHRGTTAGRAVRDGLVSGLELAAARGGATLKVTFDRSPAGRRVYRLDDPARLVLDFYRSAPAAKGTPAAPAGSAVEGLRVIVIDPGHGGHDPGANGPSGLQEKELTLDIARRVAALLQEGGGVRVLLTRTSDRFVALRERTAFANRERADLFVSIHVNSAPAAGATGTETYFLSSEATDNAARQAAAAENRVVALEGSARGAPRDMLRSILWDLAQSDFLQQSSRLAEVVQNTLDRALRLPSRGVKQAPFYVLGGAAMPAVLVEIGFLTNPSEEQRLRDDGYRDRIARAIAAGLGEYKHEYDRRAGTVARR
jgi:N-acetylmuramoyl-L-alanine amidase